MEDPTPLLGRRDGRRHAAMASSAGTVVSVASRAFRSFSASTLARAAPVALGVLTATTLNDVLGSFVESFVSPLAQIVVGDRSKRALETASFVLYGARFPYGAFVVSALDASVTLCAVFAVGVFAAWLTRPLGDDNETTSSWATHRQCRACKSWIDRDATVCPFCREKRPSATVGVPGEPSTSARRRHPDRRDEDTEDNEDTDDETLEHKDTQERTREQRARGDARADATHPPPTRRTHSYV